MNANKYKLDFFAQNHIFSRVALEGKFATLKLQKKTNLSNMTIHPFLCMCMMHIHKKGWIVISTETVHNNENYIKFQQKGGSDSI